MCQHLQLVVQEHAPLVVCFLFFCWGLLSRVEIYVGIGTSIEIEQQTQDSSKKQKTLLLLSLLLCRLSPHQPKRPAGQAEILTMADNRLLNDGVGGGDDIFVYTGGEQRVPRDVKRVRIAENVDTIAADTFANCRQLIEVEGHDRLRKIELRAFYCCYSLRRATKMQGLIEIDDYAFYKCFALSQLDFDKLEIIGYSAFDDCKSLRSINLPSVRRIGEYAFSYCGALTDATFGPDLERIETYAIYNCIALRHIAIPLACGLIVEDEAFHVCQNLSRIDTLDGGIHKTISSLHLESWRDEMQDEIDRINQTLPNIPVNEKTTAIQEWITRVLDRMEHYKSEHQVILKEATTLLELALWKANLHDDAAAQGGVRVTRGQRKRARKDRCITSGASIVIKNVLPFLVLK